MASSPRWFILALRTLLVEVLLLMALGAFVRAMNAGLACPDWPLCFGKVIPDFHPGVWYEFIHRADAGLVAITYLVLALLVFFRKTFQSRHRRLAAVGLGVLLLLISAGAMTVLKQVAWLAVTTHLGLATTFFAIILLLQFQLDPQVEHTAVPVPRSLSRAWGIFSGLVFLQILLGGVVASTYAGLVCVDWPLCNGAWLPTLSGPIGHQMWHRLLAYVLAIVGLGLGVFVRSQTWSSPQLRRASRRVAFLVVAQVILGILNLRFFVPAWLTVPHQTMALLLLAASLRAWQVAHLNLSRVPRSAAPADNPAVHPVLHA